MARGATTAWKLSTLHFQVHSDIEFRPQTLESREDYSRRTKDSYCKCCRQAASPDWAAFEVKILTRHASVGRSACYQFSRIGLSAGCFRCQQEVGDRAVAFPTFPL